MLTLIIISRCQPNLFFVLIINYQEKVLIELLRDVLSMQSAKKRLIVLLGSLGDFDSIEYAQIIAKKLKKIQSLQYELLLIGIGSQQAKIQFCNFTGIPHESMLIVKDSALHMRLGLSTGLQLNVHPWINLFLMCLGINSPGTLREVLRGYLGDKKANSLFESSERIRLGSLFSFDASLFDYAGEQTSLRPFELATQRLKNMIEVLSNWRIYMPTDEFLTQRCGTFILNKEDRLIYSYCSQGLLSYSENMSDPLVFLEQL